jgi:hypothetical protein
MSRTAWNLFHSKSMKNSLVQDEMMVRSVRRRLIFQNKRELAYLSPP